MQLEAAFQFAQCSEYIDQSLNKLFLQEICSVQLYLIKRGWGGGVYTETKFTT